MNTKKVFCSLVLGIVCVVLPSTSHAQATSDNASVTAPVERREDDRRQNQERCGADGIVRAKHRAELANAFYGA